MLNYFWALKGKMELRAKTLKSAPKQSLNYTCFSILRTQFSHEITLLSSITLFQSWCSNCKHKVCKEVMQEQVSQLLFFPGVDVHLCNPIFRNRSSQSIQLTTVTLTSLCSGDAADEVDAEGFDSKERSCVMIQTQYYLSNLSSSYNILQDCGNCSRSVHEQKYTHVKTQTYAP